MPPLDQNPKLDPATRFREALKSTTEIARALTDYCTTVAELIEVLELATINEAQLRLLAEKMDDKRR